MTGTTTCRTAGALCVLLSLGWLWHSWTTAKVGSFISCLSFSPDGKHLVAVRYDLRHIELPVGGWSIGWMLGGASRRSASGDVGRTISVIRTDEWQTAGVVESTGIIGRQAPMSYQMSNANHAVGFIGNPPVLAVVPFAKVGDWPTQLILYDVTTQKQFSSKPIQWVIRLESTPDGALMAMAGGNGVEVRIASNDSLVFSKQINPFSPRGCPAIALSPDGRFLATVGDKRAEDELPPINLWDSQTGAHVAAMPELDEMNFFRHYEMDFHPNRPLLAVATEESLRLYGFDGKSVSELLVKNPSSFSDILSICFLPDGNSIAAGTRNADVMILDLDNGTKIGSLAGSNTVRCMAKSPDGRYLATGAGYGGSISIWDAHSLELLRKIDLPGRNARVSLLIMPIGLSFLGIALVAWSFRKVRNGSAAE